MSRSVLSTLISCRAKFDIRSVPGFPDSPSTLRNAEHRRLVAEMRRAEREEQRASRPRGVVQRVRRTFSRASS